MSFVVNSAEWSLSDHADEEIVARIERLLEFVAVSAARQESVLVGDDFQSKAIKGGATLWELSMLPGEIRQELSAWLGRGPYYLEASDWPEGIDQILIKIGDETEVENVDVAWVHHAVRNGSNLACFSLIRSGQLSTVSSLGAADVFFVKDEAGRLSFWRNVLSRSARTAQELIRHSPHAYPDLLFMPDVLRSVDNLAGGYAAASDRVQLALALLNDVGRWSFNHPPPAITPTDTGAPLEDSAPSNQLIQTRLEATGLNVAPENPDVRQNGATRRAREVTIGGRTLYCEWHVKIEPHRNRIHFHAPVEESNDQLIIAIIHEHLPLPG